MKRILTLLLLFITVLSYSQLNQINVKKAYISNWIIYQGDTLAIVAVLPGAGVDSLVVTRGNTIDTLIMGGANHWDLSSNNIQNNNTGKVILPGDSTFFDVMPDVGDKVGRILHVNQYKEIEYITPSSLGDRIDSGRAASPTAYTTFVRDSTYGMLSQATDADKVTESALNDPFLNLVYWKKDFINAYYIPTDNAKIGFIGDSYTHEYADYFKKEAQLIYGYGGGYENLESAKLYSSYGTHIYIVGGWTATSVRSDAYTTHSRAYRSIANGSILQLGNLEYNRVKIHYRTRAAGGTFTVKRGSSGTPVSVNTAAAAGDDWYVVNYGNVTYTQFDTIFVTTTSADTVDLYGVLFEMIPYNETLPNFASQNKRLEVSILGDGGADLSHFYTNKDTASMRILLDSMDLSLMCIVNLEDAGGVVTELDSLIGLYRILRPEMDVAVLSAHDDKNGYGEATRVLMEKVAKNNNAAYIDVFNGFGSIEKMADASLTTDSIHVTGAGYYFPYFIMQKRLLPIPSKQGQLTAYALTLIGNTAIVKPNGTNFIFASKPLKATFTGAENTAYGYRSGEGMTTGASNSFYGYQSGMNNTTGYSNTFLGINAAAANTTGYYNVAIGQSALAFCVTNAYQNTAVGAYALHTQTNRVSLTAVGFNAVKYNTGTNTVAVGYAAVQGAAAGSSGSGHTGVGYEALTAVTVGGQCTAMGYRALYTNAAGDYNSAFGYTALNTNGAGSYNSAFGHQALYLNSSGNNNTAIGRQAGYSSTGSGNIFLGYQAGYSETGSNKLYISNTNTATPLIKGDFTAMSLNVFGVLYTGNALIADNDSTPSVAAGNTFVYAGSANSVSIDALDDHIVGAYYTIFGNSGTYTITIPDGSVAGGDSFNLSAAWVGGVDDCITLYCIAADTFKEVSRSDN